MMPFSPSAHFKAFFIASIFLLFPSLSLQADTIDMTRSSINTNGFQGDNSSSSPVVSGNGRYVAFTSSATNLVSGDSNGVDDIFVRDRVGGTTSRVSLSVTDNQGNGGSSSARMSVDGRYVVFQSTASNLVTGDTNGALDIFLRDRNAMSNGTTRISVNAAGIQGDGESTSPSVSSDGRYVVFASTATNLISGDGNAVSDIFLYDATNGSAPLALVSAGNGASISPSMSSDGRYIVFSSKATNLVAGDTNGKEDIFLYDAVGPSIIRITINSALSQANGDSTHPQISADGTAVVFQSTATNLVAEDTNSRSDIYVYNRSAGTLSLASVNSNGIIANGESSAPSVSGDGQVVSFLSDATNLVSGDTNNTEGDGNFDLFAYSRSGGTTTRKNVRVSTLQSTGGISASALNTDGTVIAFDSTASDLIPGDSNDAVDVFVSDLNCPTDSDSDATLDCSDACPFDALKIVAGSCGCGTAETDTDSDATPDCNDSCPTDATKTSEGTCGCGISDSDANSNGVADCLDPTTSTVPSKPSVSKNRGSLLVRVPVRYAGATYRYQVRRGTTVVASRSTTQRQVRFRNLRRGTLSVRYRATLGGVTTRYSRSVSIRY